MVNVGDIVVGQTNGGEWLVGKVAPRASNQYDYETSIVSVEKKEWWTQRFVITDTVIVLEKAPYVPIPEGKAVLIVRKVPGRVLRYDEEKLCYEVIVNVGREEIKHD